MCSLFFFTVIVIASSVCFTEGRPDTGFVFDGPVVTYNYEYVTTNSRIRDIPTTTKKITQRFECFAAPMVTGWTAVFDSHLTSNTSSSARDHGCCKPLETSAPQTTRPTNTAPTGVTNAMCESSMTAYPPDPNSGCCGDDAYIGNKIVAGKATGIDQYPWMALLEYFDAGQVKLLCGGSLISNRYVLTAAHCAPPRLLPRNVRLGEYNKTADGPDCAPVEAGGEDCTDGVVRILIERIIRHGEFKDSKPKWHERIPVHRDDIALLRLKDKAPYTDFIRPICLPSMDITLSPPSNLTFTVAGWGALGKNKPKSDVKMAVDVPHVKYGSCESLYALWNKQICAGGKDGKDSCNGDSGGPLMYENGKTFEVVGIVSHGPEECGKVGFPAVHTKVLEYKDWIMENIEP